jgi:transcriptional regulator with XRE-family HTH domain
MRKAGKSKFDQAVIDLVKAIREQRELSQDALAEYLDVTRGYIGQVESPQARTKYNLNQLNRLAYEMKCSPRDFIPETATFEKYSSGRKKQKK